MVQVALVIRKRHQPQSKEYRSGYGRRPASVRSLINALPLGKSPGEPAFLDLPIEPTSRVFSTSMSLQSVAPQMAGFLALSSVAGEPASSGSAPASPRSSGLINTSHVQLDVRLAEGLDRNPRVSWSDFNGEVSLCQAIG